MTKNMISFSYKIPWVRMLGLVVLLCLIYYGVKTADMVTDRLMMSHGLMEEGATKITKKHFTQPETRVFNSENFSIFLDNVTKHKEGILAWKSFYVVILFIYLVLMCLVIINVVIDKSKPENRT